MDEAGGQSPDERASRLGALSRLQAPVFPGVLRAERPASWNADTCWPHALGDRPLGHTTLRTYDVRAAMLTMTNAVGRTWNYATTPQASVSSTPRGNVIETALTVATWDLNPRHSTQQQCP